MIDGSINSNADLKAGDFLVAINGKPAEYTDLAVPLLNDNRGKMIEVTLRRNGSLINRDLNVNDEGKIEVYRSVSRDDVESAGFYKVVQNEYTLSQSVVQGLNKFSSVVSSYWMQLKLIFSPSTGAYKGVGGFKAILDIFPDTWSWATFWGITAFLSIMLGVLNLLPIPALDGGHVMFLLYEMASGRKPSDKFMEYAQTIGFLILITLVIYANGNDIYKAVFN